MLALQNPIIPPIMPLLIQKHFLFKSIFSPSINTILSTKVAGIVGKPRIPISFPCRISGSNKSIHRKFTIFFFTNSLFQLYYNGPSEVNTWKKMKNSNFLASLSRDLLNQKYLSRDLLNQKYHAQCNPKLISFHHQHWFRHCGNQHLAHLFWMFSHCELLSISLSRLRLGSSNLVLCNKQVCTIDYCYLFWMQKEEQRLLYWKFM